MCCQRNLLYTGMSILCGVLIMVSCVGQLITCPTTDACLTADPVVPSLIPVLSYTFVEIDHEIISTVIFLPSADLRRVVVSTGESMCT